MNRIDAIIQRIQSIETRFAVPPAVTASGAFDAYMAQAMGAPPTMGSGMSPEQMYAMMNGGSWAGGGAGQFAQLAATNPTAMVNYQGKDMQAQTADRFQKLEGLVQARWPGRTVTITSTTDGNHLDPNHAAGKAMDFIVDGLTKDESVELEGLCSQAGFKAYNEYIHSSPLKTGDHMHVDIT